MLWLQLWYSSLKQLCLALPCLLTSLRLQFPFPTMSKHQPEHQLLPLMGHLGAFWLLAATHLLLQALSTGTASTTWPRWLPWPLRANQSPCLPEDLVLVSQLCSFCRPLHYALLQATSGTRARARRTTFCHSQYPWQHDAAGKQNQSP